MWSDNKNNSLMNNTKIYSNVQQQLYGTLNTNFHWKTS